MKLEVGMYVRFGQVLCRIDEIEDNYISFDREFYDHWNELTYSMNYDRFINDYKPKASNNIIDLIEVGDYVNGSKLISIDYAEDNEGNCDKLHYYYQFEDDDKDINEYYEKLIIKSIVTKEQFSSIEYKVN